MDCIEKAFDFANDLTKQLISLSTGIIALTITFSTNIISAETGEFNRWIISAWIMFLFSIFFGVWTLMALTGTLEPKHGAAKPSIRGINVILPSQLQILTFIVGMALTIIYATLAI